MSPQEKSKEEKLVYEDIGLSLNETLKIEKEFEHRKIDFEYEGGYLHNFILNVVPNISKENFYKVYLLLRYAKELGYEEGLNADEKVIISIWRNNNSLIQCNFHPIRLKSNSERKDVIELMKRIEKQLNSIMEE